jgi:hypothetical protein
MSDSRGFALLEWLVASAFVLVLAGALFTTLAPVRDVIERTNHGSDLVGSARHAIDRMTADVREAGSDVAIGWSGAEITRAVPRLRLVEHLDTDVTVQPAGAMIINRVPDVAAQGRLRLAAAAGDQLLRLDTAVRCATGVPACGFREGERAALFTDTSGEVVAIDSPLVDTVGLAGPLANGYPAGAVLARFITSRYGLRAGSNGDRLVRVSDGGADQPLVDNVVGFPLTADDVDPMRVRRVTLRLRVQAPSAELRGPAGVLFRHAGTASSARRWLADVELRSEVALRNAGDVW